MTNEMIKEMIGEINKLQVYKPEEISGNMDEFTTRFTWEGVKQVLETMPKEKHFEFISSVFVMTVFHQALYTYFNGPDKHFAKQPGEYTKYRSIYKFPEFGWGGMEGSKHEEPLKLFTNALDEKVMSLEDLNTKGEELAELFKAWSEFFIEDCKLNLTYERLVEVLRSDYSLDPVLKAKYNPQMRFSSEYISALETAVRKMLGVSEEERAADLEKIKRTKRINRICTKHRKGLDYLKDK